MCYETLSYLFKERILTSLLDVLELSGLEEPKIRKDIFDLVVMKPERNKEMIKAICEIYGGSYIQNFRSDLIEGKGEGQILLLHGPPGTGKTLTAGRRFPVSLS